MAQVQYIISRRAAAVLRALLSLRGPSGRCTPSYQNIADATGLDLVDVRTGLKELQHKGSITIKHRNQRSNEYTIMASFASDSVGEQQPEPQPEPRHEEWPEIVY